MATWAYCMPPYSGPDEASHSLRAAALVHGQLEGTGSPAGDNPTTKVEVSQALAGAVTANHCYQWRPTEPASCSHVSGSPDTQVEVTIFSGRYPPLYYAIVGLPTLGTTSFGAGLLMRLLSALLSASFLALAVFAIRAWSRNSLLAIGVVAAASPVALYLGAMVNPNGLEISSAICTWVCGTILVTERPEDAPAGLLAALVLSASVLTLSRGVSPLWTALIGLTLLLLAPSRMWSMLSSHRRVRLSVVALLLVGALAATWILTQHSLNLLTGPSVGAHASVGRVVTASLGQTGERWQQMVGVLGSLDTPTPLATFALWGAATSLLFALALLVARRGQLALLVALLVAVVLVPVIIEYQKARTVGLVWQGRYTLPLAVGIPILGCALVGRAGLAPLVTRRLATVVAVACGAGAILAFDEALRRYSVGTSGPILAWTGPWQPPGGDLLAMVANAAATTGFVAVLWAVATGRMGRSRWTPAAAGMPGDDGVAA